MKQQISSSEYVVNRADVARVFGDPFARRLLLIAAVEPKTVSQLLKLTGSTMDKVYYNVGKLEGLGLFEVVGKIPRDGREMKLYQAVSRRFRIPAEYLADPSATLRKMEKDALEDARINYSDGMVMEVDDQGRMRKNLVPIDGAAPDRAREVWIRTSVSADQIEEVFNLLMDKIECLDKNQKSSKQKLKLIHLSAVTDTSGE